MVASNPERGGWALSELRVRFYEELWETVLP
jgi:hypothetical protein